MTTTLYIILIILDFLLCLITGYTLGSIILLEKRFKTFSIRLSEILDSNKEVIDINKQILNHAKDVLNCSKGIQKENKILIEHIANKK